MIEIYVRMYTRCVLAAQKDLAPLPGSNSTSGTCKSDLTSDDGGYWQQNSHALHHQNSLAHYQNGHAFPTQPSHPALPSASLPVLVDQAPARGHHNGGHCTVTHMHIMVKGCQLFL